MVCGSPEPVQRKGELAFNCVYLCLQHVTKGLPASFVPILGIIGICVLLQGAQGVQKPCVIAAAEAKP